MQVQPFDVKVPILICYTITALWLKIMTTAATTNIFIEDPQLLELPDQIHHLKALRL